MTSNEYQRAALRTTNKNLTKKEQLQDGIMGLTGEAGECADLMWKRELLKNKLYAVLLILCGVVSVLIDGDCTAFIFMLMIGLPLFFSKENWIIDGGGQHSGNKKGSRKSVRSVSDSRRKKGYEHRNSEATCRVRA